MRVRQRRRIKFVPERFTKSYINWMENVHDWCISRQLWWGHRIPAWYCDDCGAMTVTRDRSPASASSATAPTSARRRTCWIPGSPPPCGRSPRSAGRTSTEDLKYFYPTMLLVTGYDIIFFWVARMIFSAWST